MGAVYIVADESFADALAGGAAAAAAKSPVLIVQHSAIPPPTSQELVRLQPASIVIVGGIASVPEKLAGLLATYTTGPVTRLSGSDRYATAVAVSQGSFPSAAPKVFLASGSDFPDALTGGVAAALAAAPVLLVPGTCVPPIVLAEITRLNPSQVVILGGHEVLGPDVDTLTPCSTTG